MSWVVSFQPACVQTCCFSAVALSLFLSLLSWFLSLSLRWLLPPASAKLGDTVVPRLFSVLTMWSYRQQQEAAAGQQTSNKQAAGKPAACQQHASLPAINAYKCSISNKSTINIRTVIQHPPEAKWTQQIDEAAAPGTLQHPVWVWTYWEKGNKSAAYAPLKQIPRTSCVIQAPNVVAIQQNEFPGAQFPNDFYELMRLV